MLVTNFMAIRFPAAGLKTAALNSSLAVEPSNHPLTAEIEGTLGFDRSLPQFEGTLALARPVGVTLARGERVMSDPWQLTGKLRATAASASLQDLALQYGPEERAVNFSGKAELTFGEHPHLDGDISARQVDIDRALADPDVTHRPPLLMIKSFFETFVATVKPPLPGTVGVAFDAVTVGGTTLQSLHGSVRFDGKSWVLKDFAFRAPGFTEVNLSGQLDDGPHGLAFSGPAKLESADLKMLMAWLEGRTEPLPGPSKTLSARGAIAIASDRFMLEGLTAALDQESVQGRLAYTWATANRPATIDGELHSATLNVDALSAFVKAALSDSALELPRQVALVLDVGKATFAGVDARMINAKVKFDAGIVHIDRLTIGDLGGAALDISGRIDELSSQPRGRITLDLDARTLSGLTDIVGRLAPQIADAFRPFNDRLAPAKVHAALTVDRAGSSSAAKFELGGGLGAARLTLNGDATGDPAHLGAAVVRVTGRLDADDGGALVQLFNLDRVLAVDQLPGQLTLSASGPLDGAVRINGLAAAGGFSAAVDGALHLSAEQPPTGSLQIKATAADLRPLHRAMTGQPGTATATTASAIVGFAGADVSLTDLNVGSGKSSVRGRLDLKLMRPFGISGDVVADDVDVAAASAMLFGLPSVAPGSGAVWSHEPMGAGAFGVANGAITFKLGRATLMPAWVVRDLKGVVRLQPAQIALSDLEGKFAGGRLTGDIAVSHDAGDFALRGRIELAGAQAAKVLSSGNSAVDGLITMKLQAEGLGATPDALVGSLHGGGAMSLNDGSFAGIDTAAFNAAIRAAGQNNTIELSNIHAAVSAAMQNSRLAVPQAKADLTIAAGQVHLANTTVNAQDGAKLSLDGILDLNGLAIDSHLTLSAQPAANALISARPEFAINIKGPLAAPERKLDVSALVAWLALRAAELQTRRLELIEANRRNEVLGPVFRPRSPAIRFVPMGTALETMDHVDTLAGTTLGSRAFERLRSERPGVVPPIPPGGGPDTAPSAAITTPRPAAENATATTGTVQPDRRRAKAPAPAAVHSPLDLLFGSQN